jgi:membrane protein YdbS with pleckstrin-like domain
MTTVAPLPEEPAPALPPVADGVTRPLDPRYIVVQRIAGAITAAVLAGAAVPGVVALVLITPWPLGVVWLGAWLVLCGLLIWRTQAWPALAYRHASYAVDATGIEIRRGVIWRRIINVPRSRVQHTDVSQGPIERSYELGTLVIHTAGTEHARVHLSGLPHARALRIRDHLLPTGGADAV